jgi:RNA 2',3'-cyclic 3'-phosphodiesterase
MEETAQRLFFGFEVEAPWPQQFPAGRLLDKNCRHMTLAFLGQTHFLTLARHLEIFPTPPFKVGISGTFDKTVFLPEKRPRVAAWHVSWFDDAISLTEYCRTVISWLQNHGFHPDVRPDFLPHVTICRAPFNAHQWKKWFAPLPMVLKSIHLYESMGQLKYEPRWTYPLIAPFEELDHTADLAFNVHGQSLNQLQIHAFTALAFKCLPFLDCFHHLKDPQTVEDIVCNLNRLIAHIDALQGCPFKAVSYHGEIVQNADNTFTWEMIVDV